MADFELLVNAKLQGLDGIKAQLDSLGKEKTINIQANTNNVITQLDEIQRRLNQLNNTRINLGNIGGGGGNNGLNRQRQQADDLAQSYTRLMNLARTMGSLEVRFAGLNANRNGQQMDVLIQQYERVANEYNTLRSTLAQSIEPAGFQQVDAIIAQTAAHIQELHAQAGDTAAFNQQQQAINEVDRAFRDMLSLIGQMGTTRVQMAGLEDTSNQFVTLQNRLEHLQEQYNQLNNAFGGQLNAGQIGRIEQAFASIDSRVDNIQARISDVNLNNLVGQIEQIETKIHKLNATDNGNQMETLRAQLEQVRQQYEALLNDTANPNVNANNAFAQVIDNIRGRLDELDAVWMDKQQKLATGIELKVNTGTFEADIAKVTAQYEKLGTTGHPMLEQVGADIQQLTVLQQQMATAGDNTTLINTYNQYNTVLQRVRQTLQTVSADAKTFVSSLQISQLDNKIQIWAEQNSRATKEFGASIAELRQRLAILQQSGHATASDLDAIRIEFEKIKSAAISAGQTGSTFGNLMKQSMQTLMRYFSVSTLIYKGIAAIKEMCNTVLEVDTAMTRLYRVTDMTASQYESMFNQMAESAKRYGASLSEIIDATTTWVKLGFDAKTAQELGNVTTMYQHVTDLDTQTAVDNLITAYKGFQDQLDSLYAGDTAKAVSYVADIFDKLNNEFAVTAADVGQALTSSASALAVAGNSIQESAAMVTGITEVTQNAAKAGKVVARTYGNVWRVIAALW